MGTSSRPHRRPVATALLIPAMLSLLLAAACTPAPAPHDSLGTLMMRSSGSGSVVWWTRIDTPSQYRATMTSLVFGPVEVCLIAVEVNLPHHPQTRCSTINATPGGEYRIDYEFDTWELEPNRMIELGLYTRTKNNVFVGELEVLEGAPLYATS